jgi:hypothetical protein
MILAGIHKLIELQDLYGEEYAACTAAGEAAYDRYWEGNLTVDRDEDEALGYVQGTYTYDSEGNKIGFQPDGTTVLALVVTDESYHSFMTWTVAHEEKHQDGEFHEDDLREEPDEIDDFGAFCWEATVEE